MSNLTWAAIQPLTGGAYFAGEQSFGKQANWILSYPGLEKEIFGKDGSLRGIGNERHFLEYLKKKKKLPPYVQFNRGMFDDINGPVAITNDNEYSNANFNPEDTTLKSVDLIVSVPVCSGLSAANTADHGKDDSMKNNNLKFLTKFVLQSVRPKVYLFENAPALYTPKGKVVRDYLNEIAEVSGYSVTYVKTDTYLHDNIQYRPRTYVIFWKWLKDDIPPPVIGFESKKVGTITEYLSRIPTNATQNTKEFECYTLDGNQEYAFISKKFGKNWRDTVGRYRLKSFIILNGLADEFYKFHKDEKLKAHYDYCLGKKAIGMGYYDRSFFSVANEKMPTVYHGNTWSALHPIEDRCFTFREYMHFMGLPHDLNYLHNFHSFGSVVGQNVPVRTTKFWIDECRKVLEDWDNKRIIHPEGNKSNIYFHNNVRPEQSKYSD